MGCDLRAHGDPEAQLRDRRDGVQAGPRQAPDADPHRPREDRGVRRGGGRALDTGASPGLEAGEI